MACRPRRARQIAPKRAIEQFSLSREKNQTKTPRDAGRFAFLRYRGAENSAPGDRHVVARVVAGVDLPRAADLELRVFLLLEPVREIGRAACRERGGQYGWISVV